MVIFLHITQGYHTSPQGTEQNNSHAYAWTRGIIMINTLPNLLGRISLVVQATYHTHACGTHAILGLDNS